MTSRWLSDCSIRTSDPACVIKKQINKNEQFKLLPSDPTTDNHFGWAVDLDQNCAIVGAPQDNHAGTGSGSAYIFRYDGVNWSPPVKLVATDAGGSDQFGCSVALSGATAIVGAHSDDNDGGISAGAAYVFRFDGVNWTQQAKLTASDAGTYDYFGCAVDLDGETALVGAYGNDSEGANPGAAYICNLPCLFLRGDLNNDCRVDLYDYALLAVHWLIDCKTNPSHSACGRRWK